MSRAFALLLGLCSLTATAQVPPDFANLGPLTRRSTGLALIVWRPTDATAAPPYTLARYEPRCGVLLGAFVDRDLRLPVTSTDASGTQHRDLEAFGELVGRPHGTGLTYLGYGEPFPRRWADELWSVGAVPQIAWEPNEGLGPVRDDEYLRGFAAAAAAFGQPVFLRFASEMNGTWAPYHGDPQRYREAFRLVARTMHAAAPNVIMVWCPYCQPVGPLDSYYPGDDAVDWVGVNLYSVFYHNGDPQQPASAEDPTDLLRPVYDRYASRKPIAICEYAASHQAKEHDGPRPQFAIGKMRRLYGALPARFPRVKMITWYNCDNLTAGNLPEERRLNDYSLTTSEAVLAAYRTLVSDDYFVSSLPAQGRACAPFCPERARSTVQATLPVRLTTWEPEPSDGARSVLQVDGQEVAAAPTGTGLRLDLSAGSLRPGSHAIRLTVSRGRQTLQSVTTKLVVH